MLINLPRGSQEALLIEMFSLLKPGGIIALQEFDSASYVCYPEHPSWTLLLNTWNDVFHSTGGNEFVGRSLAHRLHCLGAKNVEMKIHVGVAQIGEYRRMGQGSEIHTRSSPASPLQFWGHQKAWVFAPIGTTEVPRIPDGVSAGARLLAGSKRRPAP